MTMNPVRLLRLQAGMTQKELALRSKTSQSAIAAYESGAKSPTFSTLQRICASLGREVSVSFPTKLTREDQRSLAYHEEVAARIKRDPELIIARAKETLARLEKKNPGARALFSRWSVWLNLSPEELISRILDAGIEARDMRQVTPFAGVLSPQERAAVLRRFREEYAEKQKYVEALIQKVK